MMRFGIHVFADEREAVEALVADRRVRRADVRRAAKRGRHMAEVYVWRAFT
jgi:hypothetical protein